VTLDGRWDRSTGSNEGPQPRGPAIDKSSPNQNWPQAAQLSPERIHLVAPEDLVNHIRQHYGTDGLALAEAFQNNGISPGMVKEVFKRPDVSTEMVSAAARHAGELRGILRYVDRFERSKYANEQVEFTRKNKDISYSYPDLPAPGPDSPDYLGHSEGKDLAAAALRLVKAHGKSGIDDLMSLAGSLQKPVQDGIWEASTAVQATARVAEISVLADLPGIITDVARLVGSGRLENLNPDRVNGKDEPQPKSFSDFLGAVRADLVQPHQDFGNLRALQEASRRAQLGNKVELEGRADLVDHTDKEAIQIKSVTSSLPNRIAQAVNDAGIQLTGATGEIPPERYKRVVHVWVDNTMNPAYEMSQKELKDFCCKAVNLSINASTRPNSAGISQVPSPRRPPGPDLRGGPDLVRITNRDGQPYKFDSYQIWHWRH
jgi:hypothetical protein